MTLGYHGYGSRVHDTETAAAMLNLYSDPGYDKTGARTRGELSATVFFGEHLPRIQSQVAVGDDASFVDAPRPRT
jgi:hypothetical protein